MANRVPYTLQQAASTTGNGGVANLNNLDELHFRIKGTHTGLTVNFEASFDGTNFEAVTCYKGSDSSAATTANANSAWSFGVGAYVLFRARISAIATGSVTIEAEGK